MDTTSLETTDRRAGTEQNLDDEHATRNSPPLGSATARRISDDLLERDRIAADSRLGRFRERADSLLAYERALSSRAGCVTERSEADQHTKDERENMDAVLERERERADAARDAERRGHDADAAGTAARRLDTNAQLAMERQRTDRTLTALKESQSSLAHAQDLHGHDRDVLAIVTHDLRGPLSVITVNAQHIAERAQEPSMRETADDVVRAAARMGRLLIDLLDAVRIDAGTLRIVKASHDAYALAAEIVHSYQPLFSSRRLAFIAEIPVGSAFAPFDYDRLIQVLSNLLGNALKFTPQDGMVRLRVQAQTNAIEFVVRDTGPGIPAADLPHVFDKFWQIGSVARRGLGLGLHICKSIVEGHGGRIWVESAFGQGAAFFFSLPTIAGASSVPGDP